ncbi:hypothetical protein AVEN_114733-1, partial [Araneus ventricosus]
PIFRSTLSISLSAVATARTFCHWWRHRPQPQDGALRLGLLGEGPPEQAHPALECGEGARPRAPLFQARRAPQGDGEGEPPPRHPGTRQGRRLTAGYQGEDGDRILRERALLGHGVRQGEEGPREHEGREGAREPQRPRLARGQEGARQGRQPQPQDGHGRISRKSSGGRRSGCHR